MVCTNLLHTLFRKTSLGGALVATALLPALFSCNRDNPVNPHNEEKEKQIIHWNVLPPYKINVVKSLVESQEDLEDKCSPFSEGGAGKAIGFWVGELKEENGELIEISDVFGVDRSRLMHFPKVGSPVPWNYDGENQSWDMGSRYSFRAFYPQDMSSAIITESSTAQLLTLEYNTYNHQDDFMVGYNEVYTEDPVLPGNPPTIMRNFDPSTGELVDGIVTMDYGETKRGLSLEFDLSDPVPLHMHHTLAAVQIRFRFAYDDSDEITGLEFFNGPHTHFKNVGLLLYGLTEDPLSSSGIVSPPDPTKPYLPASQVEQDRLRGKDSFTWITYKSSYDNVPFYSWMIEDETQGMPFGRTTTVDNLGNTIVEEKVAIAYKSSDSYMRIVTVNGGTPDTTMVAGTHTFDLEDKIYPDYTENDGWILLVPQNSSAVMARFRTKKMGETIFDLSNLKTNTNADGDIFPGADWFAPGRKYVFTITLTGVSVEASVDIADWNKRYSTVNIQF